MAPSLTNLARTRSALIEHDGRRWLQQWRMPPQGHDNVRAWVDVAELRWPLSNVRPLRPGR